jgi:hypothetical protein
MGIGLSRFGRLDLSNPHANPLLIDVSAVARMSPSSGLIEIIAGSEDSITVTDAADWRMGEPIIENGTFVLTAGHTGIGGESIRARLPNGWRNFLRPADINNDGGISAGDALNVINELSQRAFSDADTELLNDPLGVAVWPNRYLDHNGDNSVTALDALRVINDLARALSDGGSGEGEATQTAVAQTVVVSPVGSAVSPAESPAESVSPAETPFPTGSAVFPVKAVSPVKAELDSDRGPVGSAAPDASGPIGRSTIEARVLPRFAYAAAVDELLSDEFELDLLASVAISTG